MAGLIGAIVGMIAAAAAAELGRQGARLRRRSIRLARALVEAEAAAAVWQAALDPGARLVLDELAGDLGRND